MKGMDLIIDLIGNKKYHFNQIRLTSVDKLGLGTMVRYDKK
jgi:phosphomevalonate kinase